MINYENSAPTEDSRGVQKIEVFQRVFRLLIANIALLGMAV